MEAFLRDLKHSLRMFAQSPAFTLAAIAALTLGIGATTAIFSVVNAVLLTPLSVPDADRVAVLMVVGPDGDNPGGSPAKFAHFRQQTEVVQDVAAISQSVMNYTGSGFPEQIKSGRTTADFFRLMDAPFRLGRGFTADEDAPHAPNTTVLSREFWERRFNADPNIVGKSISLGGEPYTIVGVLDTFDFREFGVVPQVWVPFQFDPNTKDQGHYFRIIGRLKPGVTPQQANDRLKASSDAYRSKFANGIGPKASFLARPIRDVIIGEDTRR
jgi:ABC-type antimicrobial peptide transport system permease subunit